MSGAPKVFKRERWRVCARFPAYSVSDHGRVRRDAIIKGGCGSTRYPSGFLSQRPVSKYGHRCVTVCMNNKPATVLVHRLVAEAFLPAPAAGKRLVCHRDDDPTNNHYKNLFWGSHADNSAQMVRKKRHPRGSAKVDAKLTESDVTDIRSRAASGDFQRDIAASMGVSQSNVSLIVSRKTWSHVT